jgi:serine/threonine protein kinase
MTPADEPPTVTQAPADSRGSFDHSLPIETVAFPGSSGMAGEPVRPVQLGEVIAGRYELVSEIGSGGMGVIYAARDRVLNRDVAVKLLIDRFSAQSNTARRFVEEAQIASQLQHPGVAPVHDLGTLPNGRPFLVMKLIKGRTLAEILSREKPQTSTLVEWFHGIARTIAYAHNKSVIHRDLKPSNVMVGAFGEIQRPPNRTRSKPVIPSRRR